MGLCKCSKKVVTNQFCFEHRVNVCENCMVTDHTKCVVLSYLLWLDDSDYNPNCHFCNTELAEKDCIRLICYHIFHWECLNKYCSELPPNTAPAGYTCPVCNVGVFPPSNMISPVAEALRNTLLGVNWARCGLAFPLIEDNAVHQTPVYNNSREASPRKTVPLAQFSQHVNKVSDVTSQHTNYTNISHMQQTDVSRTSRPEPYGASYVASGHYVAPRKLYDSTEHSHLRPTLVDHDEDKYKRRSAMEWFSRWFHSKTGISGMRRKDPNILYKRWMVIGMLALIALCTATVLFLRMGRANADLDPMLDPRLNPNIRVHDAEGAIAGDVRDADKNGLPDLNIVIHPR